MVYRYRLLRKIMGQKYAAYDANGNINAFYDSVDSPVPAGLTNVIEITDAQWQTCINNQGQWYVSDGALAPVPPPTAAELLAQAQAAQTAILSAAYAAAINAPVSYTTAAGTTAVFNQNAVAKANLQNAMLASEKSGEWAINLWLSASGAPVTPFTYADLQGLAAAMEAIDAPDYQLLLQLIAQANAATTVAAVQAVVWPS
ncbi:hypothetical protein PQR39_35125 [Paraburkholderia sediminicola]|uniref:DUF4376 domain-containing protein n=1 Tax=Paraburkholderia sediminicola TaxID=458836 RepID=UPI0038BC8BB3